MDLNERHPRKLRPNHLPASLPVGQTSAIICTFLTIFVFLPPTPRTPSSPAQNLKMCERFSASSFQKRSLGELFMWGNCARLFPLWSVMSTEADEMFFASAPKTLFERSSRTSDRREKLRVTSSPFISQPPIRVSRVSQELIDKKRKREKERRE
ncbi:hypothetical protein ABW19_dt0206262 [Dactylella cylindrospora]|nr:hypothetical protein ABW19_dt0206262 [Dactylella cylindrospora]